MSARTAVSDATALVATGQAAGDATAPVATGRAARTARTAGARAATGTPATAGAGQPPLRILPIPQTAPPPLDRDEVFSTPATGYVQAALAVDFRTPDDDDYFDRQPTTSRDLPDPHAVATELAQALVEVMAGTRPAPQLVRWTAPDVYAVLARRSLVAARRTLPAARRPIVRRVRVSEPADGVAEACAVVIHHDRVRALAMRMVGLDRRWVITDLSVG